MIKISVMPIAFTSLVHQRQALFEVPNENLQQQQPVSYRIVIRPRIEAKIAWIHKFSANALLRGV
jgi:hypothetical protein